MKLSDFDYELPPDLIAQHPARERGASRLLHLDGRSGNFTDTQFKNLPDLLKAGDLLVMNDTRVIKARLRGRKESGGQVEVLIERVLDHDRALEQREYVRAVDESQLEKIRCTPDHHRDCPRGE